MIDIVTGILIRDGKVLLGKRSPTRQSYPATWDFPGGHVEAGETIEAALIRELQEEIDVTATNFRVLNTFAEPNGAPILFHNYLVTGWEGEPAMLGDEHTELSWFHPGEASALPELTFQEYQPLLRNLCDGANQRKIPD